MLGILKYFHHIDKKSSSDETQANLPDQSGPLSKVIPSSMIAMANEKVSAIEGCQEWQAESCICI